MIRLLFVCKRRNVGYSYGIPFGLLNSARFVSNALGKYSCIASKVVDVVDGNSIDREVHLYRPTHVIIEALWATPEKIEELLKRWPKVKWIIRSHSKVPFIAMEGIAMEWIGKYAQLTEKYCNLEISANSPEFNEELSEIFDIDAVYLPNIYEPPKGGKRKNRDKVLDIGCFGAIRPLKNQLQQAIAAIRFADKIKKPLRFHINASRTEQKGEQVLKNLRNLFKHTKHELVEHSWQRHSTFLELVRQMDLGLQVSLTESFNIVTADFVSQGVPIVVSPDITWMPRIFMADPNSSDSIVRHLWLAHRFGFLNIAAKIALATYNDEAISEWLGYLEY